LYLTEGFNDPAVSQFKKVVAAAPNDTLSAKLLAQLETSQKPAADDTTATPATAAAATDAAQPAGPSFPLSGTWTASPATNQTITLVINADNTFTWTVNQGGQTHDLKGSSTSGNGLLTLAPAGGAEPLAGRVAWQDASHFKFQAGGPTDPGLAFEKK